ncbi:MAG: GH39 family glycosyl hydrolase [Thermogutta sp.]
MHNRRRFLGIGCGLAATKILGSLTPGHYGNNAFAYLKEQSGELPHTNFLDGSSQAVKWLEQVVGPSIGQLTVKASRDIQSSPFSVGLETLDRSMYDPRRIYGPLGKLGVKWARLQTGWARTEETPGVYNFGWLDEVVDAVIAERVTPWFNVGYGNRLYTPEAPDVSAVGWIPIYNADAQKAWLRYVRALVDHFRNRVKHWEIWNEPNIKGFWKPGDPSPELYTEFVVQTAKIIREIIPDATIIGGALAGMPTDYLQKLLACGLARHVDKISFHPYRPIPEAGYRETLEKWRQLIRTQGNDRVQLWQGENGCPSQPGSTGALGNIDWNEIAQSKWLLRRVLFDRVLGLELTSYFHMVDLVGYNWGQGPSDKTNFKGLLRGTDYSPKPSYFAYQRICTLFDHGAQRDSGLDAKVEVIEAGEPNAATADSAPLKDWIPPAGFIRNGAPLWCFWYASDLIKPNPLRPLTMSVQQSGLSSSDLFYLDLLSGNVLRISKLTQEQNGRLIRGLPVGDYPVVIGSLRAIEDLVSS